MLLDRLIENLHIPGREGLQSLGVLHGRYVQLNEDKPVSAKWTLDAAGALMIPGLIQPHCHLDKNYSLAGRDCDFPSSDNLRGAIAAMQELKNWRTQAQVAENMERALTAAVRCGTSALVTHIDLTSENDLKIIDMALNLKHKFANLIDLKITTLSGLSSSEELALARKALALGADALGGCPALTDDPDQAVLNAIQIAEQFNCPLDLHIDETEDPESKTLERLADLVIERGFSNRVRASHCCSLAFMQSADRQRIIDKLVRSGIHIVALPACNLVLMGAQQSPAPRGIAPVRELLDAGVNVAVGCDNVQDPFQPWGSYDPLYTASLNAMTAQLQGEDFAADSLSMVSSRAAWALGIENYGIEAGCRADFSLVEAGSVRQAIAEQPVRSWVFFRGEPILHQQLQQQWLDEDWAGLRGAV